MRYRIVRVPGDLLQCKQAEDIAALCANCEATQGKPTLPDDAASLQNPYGRFFTKSRSFAELVAKKQQEPHKK